MTVSPDSQLVIISCMAVRDLDWWPWTDSRPRLIEWPGEGGGHPSWSAKADRLRDGRGAVLPALRRTYGIADDARIAVVGFSAGSNSGVRALLKSPHDRGAIDFAGCFDGFHLTLKDRSVWGSGALSPFFANQVEGFAAFALEAARGNKGMVMTASDVAAPRSSGLPFSQSRFVASRLMAYVSGALQQSPSGSGGLSPEVVEALLREAPPGPFSVEGLGRLVSVIASGKDAEAHKVQARAFVPILLRATLAEEWRPDRASV